MSSERHDTTPARPTNIESRHAVSRRRTSMLLYFLSFFDKKFFNALVISFPMFIQMHQFVYMSLIADQTGEHA